ncbi:hypothetical protein DRB96_37660 [Streptomyces sp. ICC1]|nr:hypothetical protein DRB89_38300 [Streptomyces sp. ICC4]AWZ16946.1 hypothetical protein DRB96_37660 [Streptomyces sp. ICC1]
MYFAAAAMSTLALGVTVASGWSQDRPDADSGGAGVGSSLSAWSADWPTGFHVEANVQHADVVVLRTDSDVIWS